MSRTSPAPSAAAEAPAHRRSHSRHLTVAGKLRLAIGVLLAGMGALGTMYWHVSDGVGQASTAFQAHQHFGALSLQLQEHLSELRRAESAYADTHSLHDRDAVFAARGHLLATLAAVRRDALAHAFDADVQAIARRVARYAGGMDDLDHLVARVGHDENDGLQGELRTAVHGVEDIVKQQNDAPLMVSMLMMRRHEKDFILRGDQKYADKVGEEAKPFARRLKTAHIDASARGQLATLMSAYQDAFRQFAAARFALHARVGQLDADATAIDPPLQRLDRAAQRSLDVARARQIAQTHRMNQLFSLTLLLVAASVVAMLWMVLRALVRPLRDAMAVADAIANDRLDGTVPVHNPHDELGHLATRLARMQDNLRTRIDRERAAAGENERVRQALDAANANMMVVDTDGAVAYANRALCGELATLAAIGAERVATLPGRRLVELHADLGAFVKQLAGARQPLAHELAFAETRFILKANPIMVDGQHLGTALEWHNRALELTIESEVAAIVRAAADGDLAARVDVVRQDGFLRTLGDSINALLETLEQNLGEVQSVLAALAEGDLTRRMEGRFGGMFAAMQANVAHALQQLETMVRGIQHAAASVHAAASEIATGTDDLSGRTESQARELQEVAALLAELGDAVRQNADGAHRVTAATGSALAAAHGGSSVVGEAAERMAEIREASRRVADITGVIDGIAFQTNILALNAAVEAARAGEHGRGFAVVASEVRALAQRSASSAREIKTLIEDASRKVQAGAELVEGVGHAMGDILESVGRVETTMQSIADASRRQENGIERVDAMLGRIEGATQQNAALAEETSAATGSLTQQSDGLSAAAQRFVVQPKREAKVKAVRPAA